MLKRCAWPGGHEGHISGAKYKFCYSCYNALARLLASSTMQLCKIERCCASGQPSSVCQAVPKLRTVLTETFQYPDFMPGQLDALIAIAHGQDAFVHMRTGGGKSLCMYLIPLAFGCDAMGIIVSPLVGLMEQQVS